MSEVTFNPNRDIEPRRRAAAAYTAAGIAEHAPQFDDVTRVLRAGNEKFGTIQREGDFGPEASRLLLATQNGEDLDKALLAAVEAASQRQIWGHMAGELQRRETSNKRASFARARQSMIDDVTPAAEKAIEEIHKLSRLMASVDVTEWDSLRGTSVDLAKLRKLEAAMAALATFVALDDEPHGATPINLMGLARILDVPAGVNPAPMKGGSTTVIEDMAHPATLDLRAMAAYMRGSLIVKPGKVERLLLDVATGVYPNVALRWTSDPATYDSRLASIDNGLREVKMGRRADGSWSAKGGW